MREHPTSRRQHQRRYGSLDQGLVHRWETRIVGSLLSSLAPPPRSCLDAPAGYGRFVPSLRAALTVDLLVGIDRNPARLVAFAEQEPRVVQADLLEALPFADGAFDLVLCLRLLQHLRLPAERARALRELRRVSRQHLLLSYYRAHSLHGLQRALRARYRRRPLATLSGAQLARETRAAGWELVTDRPVWRGVHAQSIALLRAGGLG